MKEAKSDVQVDGNLVNGQMYNRRTTIALVVVDLHQFGGSETNQGRVPTF